MSVRTCLVVAIVALPAMAAAILVVEKRAPPLSTTAPPRTALVPVAPSRAIEAERPTTVIDRSQTDEATVIAYAAMRDDINPKPRLQLIDAWNRDAAPMARLDLLSQAMVDPDEAVRARAQELFDRRIRLH